MKVICNIAEPQKGKSTYTLRETETCLDFTNINLVFEYNMVVEDLLKKAAQFDYSCERLLKKNLQKYRSSLIKDEIPEMPTMMVGIMDTHRASYLEGYLVWMKERGLLTRGIIDEYDVFQIGFRDMKLVARDNWLAKAMKEEWFDIFEFNSATNINGVITDIEWDDVNVMSGYEGYCGWDTLQIQDLPNSDFIDLLNGDITRAIERKITRAWESNENLLVNCADKVEDHSFLIETLERTEYNNSSKMINYKTKDTISDIPESNTCIIGGKSFGRSISIPNLTTMIYHRNSMPAMATVLQAVGRVLGPRRMDPTLITTTALRKAVENGRELEKVIMEEEILLMPPLERQDWLTSYSRNLDNVRLFTSKSNGFRENMTSTYQVTDEIEGYQMADRHHEIEMPLDLWNDWENKNQSSTVGRRFNEIVLKELPFLKKVEPVIDRNDNSKRTWIAIKHHQEHHKRYVLSKNNYRQYPYMIGRIPDQPGMGYCIEKIAEHGDSTYHHDEYGKTVRLVTKIVERIAA